MEDYFFQFSEVIVITCSENRLNLHGKPDGNNKPAYFSPKALPIAPNVKTLAILQSGTLSDSLCPSQISSQSALRTRAISSMWGERAREMSLRLISQEVMRIQKYRKNLYQSVAV